MVFSEVWRLIKWCCFLRFEEEHYLRKKSLTRLCNLAACFSKETNKSNEWQHENFRILIFLFFSFLLFYEFPRSWTIACSFYWFSVAVQSKNLEIQKLLKFRLSLAWVIISCRFEVPQIHGSKFESIWNPINRLNFQMS